MISTGALQELVREQEERIAQREAAVDAAEAHARSLVEQAERELNAARVEADATLEGANAKARADEQAAAKLLDAMGVPAGARDYAALEDEGRHERLAASGFALTSPAPIFPRLETPVDG